MDDETGPMKKDLLFVECPQCHEMKMPMGNDFCSLKCYLQHQFNEAMKKIK